jgi:hypothetical protein
MRIGGVKGPTWRDLVIPLGMGGGAAIGFLVALIIIRASEPNVRSPDDPGDAAAMFGMAFMFIGAVVGTSIGIVVAIVLYLMKRWQSKSR